MVLVGGDCNEAELPEEERVHGDWAPRLASRAERADCAEDVLDAERVRLRLR